MNTQHTALPWSLWPKRKGDPPYSVAGPPDGGIGLPVTARDISTFADAEFILRACNNFYPLLEALENIIEWGVSKTGHPPKLPLALVGPANAAIERAKEEK